MNEESGSVVPRKVKIIRALVAAVFLIIVLSIAIPRLTRLDPKGKILSEVPPQYKTQAEKVLGEIPPGLYNDFSGEELVHFLDGTTPFTPPDGLWKYVLSNKTASTNAGNTPPYGWNYPPLFNLARSEAAGKDERQAAEALTMYVRQEISYNVDDASRPYSANRMMEEKTGVCEQKTKFLIALLRSIGIPAREVEAGYIAPQPGHAWVEAYVGGEWIMCDPTNGFFDKPQIFMAIGWNFDYVHATEPDMGESYTVDRKKYYFP